MKKKVGLILAILMIVSMFLAACGGGGGGAASSGIKRHNPPADFANAKNPFEGNADAVAAGKQVFDTNCAPCHGQDASGNGSAATGITPKPANLQLTAKETNAQYIHWVDTVGGANAGLSSSMPSFKDSISDDDLWRIATYLTKTYSGK